VHRLEPNRFLTDLIAASLEEESLGVSHWWGSRGAHERLDTTGLHEAPIPDCVFFLETSIGPIECYLEWDRGTETLERLTAKLRSYWYTEALTHERVVNVLLVVPSERRLQALVDAVAADAKCRREDERNSFTPKWPLWAALTRELATEGPLGRVWRSLRDPTEGARLPELPAQADLLPIERERGLGQQWRKDRTDFWHKLSPLGMPAPSVPSPRPNQPDAPTITRPSGVERMREQLLAEARRDAQTAKRAPILRTSPAS
jgi:hypothetical protein